MKAVKAIAFEDMVDLSVSETRKRWKAQRAKNDDVSDAGRILHDMTLVNMRDAWTGLPSPYAPLTTASDLQSMSFDFGRGRVVARTTCPVVQGMNTEAFWTTGKLFNEGTASAKNLKVFAHSRFNQTTPSVLGMISQIGNHVDCW